MAGRGPAPKPSALRQRTNKKSGATVLTIGAAPTRAAVPELPNHDDRDWHPFTLREWARWWASPMAAQWLDSDLGGLAMLALLHDEFYKTGNVEIMKEIRLQRPCFGLTPLDRSRLQWEVVRADEAEQKVGQRHQAPARRASGDPRTVLQMVPKR
jgi:hypothetical protein